MRAVLVLLSVMGAAIAVLMTYGLVLLASFAGRPYWLPPLLAVGALMGVVALVGRRARKHERISDSRA